MFGNKRNMIIGVKHKNNQIYFSFFILSAVKILNANEPNIETGNAKSKYQL